MPTLGTYHKIMVPTLVSFKCLLHPVNSVGMVTVCLFIPGECGPPPCFGGFGMHIPVVSLVCLLVLLIVNLLWFLFLVRVAPAAVSEFGTCFSFSGDSVLILHLMSME